MDNQGQSRERQLTPEQSAQLEEIHRLTGVSKQAISLAKQLQDAWREAESAARIAILHEREVRMSFSNSVLPPYNEGSSLYM